MLVDDSRVGTLNSDCCGRPSLGGAASVINYLVNDKEAVRRRDLEGMRSVRYEDDGWEGGRKIYVGTMCWMFVCRVPSDDGRSQRKFLDFDVMAVVSSNCH